MASSPRPHRSRNIDLQTVKENRTGMTKRITSREACLRIRNSQSLEELRDFVKRLHLRTVSFVEIREPYKRCARHSSCLRPWSKEQWNCSKRTGFTASSRQTRLPNRGHRFPQRRGSIEHIAVRCV